MKESERWYAVSTQSRHERRVERLVQEEIDKNPGSDRDIREVLVPTREEWEIRRGKRVLIEKPLYPGYVLVRMVLNDDTKHTFGTMKGVALVGQGGPQPLPDEEVNRILGIDTGDDAETRDEVPFRPGQAVEIVQGPFTEFSGTVQEVDGDKGKVKVEVSLFGRPTSVELDFTQLKGF